jgi:hypothetical protein
VGTYLSRRGFADRCKRSIGPTNILLNRANAAPKKLEKSLQNLLAVCISAARYLRPIELKSSRSVARPFNTAPGGTGGSAGPAGAGGNGGDAGTAGAPGNGGNGGTPPGIGGPGAPG